MVSMKMFLVRLIIKELSHQLQISKIHLDLVFEKNRWESIFVAM